jgi:peroxiredoxin
MSSSSPFQRIIAMLLIGFGLIAVGVAAMTLITLRRSQGVGQDVSTVPVKVDYPAPSLSLTDLDGVSRSLSDYQGQVVLVNLWATWCPPCREEMPTLESFYQAHREQGFVIIGLNDGDVAIDVRDFVTSYGLTFPIWLDPTYISESVFNTMNLPSSFVIDRRGQVRLQWVGMIDRDKLEEYVVPIIEE